MNTERCISIIKQNINKLPVLENYLDKFYTKCGLGYGELLTFDSWRIVQLIAERFKTISMFIPMKDDELGALYYYNKVGCSYVFVNSSIPEANMRFAYCHELYHLMNPSIMPNNGIEMYLDTEYPDNEEEIMANAFAGAILMPEAKLKAQFNMINSGSKSVLETVVKLTDCFGAPYIATIIRCFELGLIKDTELIPELLSITKESIYQLYDRYWLNTNMLLPNKIDQFSKLTSLLGEMSDRLIEEEDLTLQDKNYILEKVNTLYNKIKA